eukprot:snap_masked-scaffold_13-processed-gene-4.36-mRNA-1 protein AED:1.00 eAED:1.00 QI:0/0/0/0/1/1/2/0/76
MLVIMADENSYKNVDNTETISIVKGRPTTINIIQSYYTNTAKYNPDGFYSTAYTMEPVKEHYTIQEVVQYRDIYTP